VSLVLWSGGCDSSLVLYDLARKEGTRAKPIRALTVHHSSVNARKEQARARKRILAEFKKQGLHVIASEVEINCLGPEWPARGGAMQPAIWVSMATQIIMDDEKLYTGHCEGDSMWVAYGQAYAAFKALCSLMDKEKADWIFPLLSTSKEDIFRRLKQAGLYDLCWWCEVPTKGKVCGTCVPCKTHETALWKAKRWPVNAAVKLAEPKRKRKRKGK